MLEINDKEYILKSTEIKYVDSKYNSKEGYAILVTICFNRKESDEIKGYISFYVGFFDNKDFSNITNKLYLSNPAELNSDIDCMEIFDTYDFIDFIDSDVDLKFGNIIDNKIKMKLLINDETIKIKYDGLMDIVK